MSGFSTSVGHVICGILFTLFWLAEAVEVIGIPESSVHRAVSVTGIVVIIITITITSITISTWSTWDENPGPSVCKYAGYCNC